MNTQQISYRELATLPKAAQKLAAFRAVLSVIPDSGCRLFIHCDQHCLSVVDGEGEPMFFPSVDFALTELAKLPGIDHHVTVDLISLLPRVMTRTRFFDGIEKVSSRLLGQSRPANNSSEST